MNALQDAVILANCIRDLNSASVNDVNACFADYREQCFEHVKKQYKASKLSAKLIYGHVCAVLLSACFFFFTLLIAPPFDSLFDYPLGTSFHVDKVREEAPKRAL